MFSGRNNPTDEERVPSGPPVNETQTTSMPWDTRVQCFVGTFILSIISSLCASYLLVLMRFTGFSIMTSIGAVLSLISTCFLTGPVNQIKKMFQKNRWLASLLYIIMIILTLVAGLVIKSAPLALFCIVGQYVAMAWYSLSYIPYAREAVSKLLCSCL